jgi:hypothetical protein
MPGSTAARQSRPRADGCRAPNYGSTNSFAAGRKISVGLARLCDLLLNKSARSNTLGTRADVRSRTGLCLSRSLFPGSVISRPEKRTPKHPHLRIHPWQRLSPHGKLGQLGLSAARRETSGSVRVCGGGRSRCLTRLCVKFPVNREKNGKRKGNFAEFVFRLADGPGIVSAQRSMVPSSLPARTGTF